MAAFVGRGPPKREEGYWGLKTHSTTVEYSSSTTSNPPFYFFEILEGLEELDVKETEYHPFKVFFFFFFFLWFEDGQYFHYRRCSRDAYPPPPPLLFPFLSA